MDMKKAKPAPKAKGYAKGGVTSLQRKQMGRGLAKVANQKKSSFTYKKGA
tara:strand:- start:926 stop:1075 length:150 start_codon:yes stop_codon:yes gene_type:complete